MRKKLSIVVALAAVAVIAAATVSSAFADSVSLSVDSCLGGGYSYYANADGGTYELYNNSGCLRALQYSFNSPDGTGWVIYNWQQAFSNLDDHQSFSTQVASCHELVYGFDGSGEKCTVGN